MPGDFSFNSSFKPLLRESKKVMKNVKFLLFAFLGLVTLSCTIDGEHAKIISIYEGRWSGTYTGPEDSGVWEMQVNKEGQITGITKSNMMEGSSVVKGSVQNSGAVYVSTGSTSGGAIFIGEMSGDVATGSWVNKSVDFNGEWSGDLKFTTVQKK